MPAWEDIARPRGARGLAAIRAGGREPDYAFWSRHGAAFLTREAEVAMTIFSPDRLRPLALCWSNPLPGVERAASAFQRGVDRCR